MSLEVFRGKLQTTWCLVHWASKNSRASSEFRSFGACSPRHFSNSSNILILLQGGEKSISYILSGCSGPSGWYLMTQLPVISFTISDSMCSVIESRSLKSAQAMQNSQLVYSGLCVWSMDSFLKFFPISQTLSSPPITSCFKNSSGAILMYSFISRSLWWVTKGLALAPPGMTFIIGVSTSRNLSLSRQLLTNLMTLVLVMKVFLVLLLMIRSRNLFLYRVSLLVSPTLLLGSMWRQGDKRRTWEGAIESSFVTDLPGFPTNPTISPLLMSL